MGNDKRDIQTFPSFWLNRNEWNSDKPEQARRATSASGGHAIGCEHGSGRTHGMRQTACRIRKEMHSEACHVAIRRAQRPPMGVRIGEKYSFATDATANPNSQLTVRAHTGVRMSETSVASAPNAHVARHNPPVTEPLKTDNKLLRESNSLPHEEEKQSPVSPHRPLANH